MTPVNTPHADIPGISQAMIAGPGRLMFLSGQIPLGPNGIATGDLHAQAEQTMANFAAVLQAAGADWSNVARITFYVRDFEPSQLETLRALRDKWIVTDTPPASALIGVASLFHPDALIEIDGIAILPPQ